MGIVVEDREVIVVHYSEIGIKGRNRSFFENKLVENIKGSLKGEIKEVYKRYGKIICELEKNVNSNKIINRLSKIPGISSFMFAKKALLDLNEIKVVALNILKDKDFDTFRISTSRSNKSFEKNSQEINRIIGEHIVKSLDKKVLLKDPDIDLHIEISEKEAFVGYEIFKGIGGLPVGSSGKLICSLSGGIDSPVAGFLMMKRGCKIIFVHIYNSTQTREALLSKIEDIVRKLAEIQLSAKLYIIPFGNIQRQIIAKIPSKYRMIVYRRFMFRIINEIGKKEKARGVVTGDSIGQVASQTIENLSCIYDASDLPVFSPLIGMNKDEIVNLAKWLGTYEYSIKPYPDCCSFMIAKHPETKANLDKIKDLEKSIEDIDKLIKDCILRAKVRTFRGISTL